MSWVFLTGDFAFKLKKSVKYPYLDYSTVERRRHFCLEEVRLNRRLTDAVYLGIMPLYANGDGFSLTAGSRVADFLVVMRQLPADAMLDNRILSGKLRTSDVAAVVNRLADFYMAAQRPSGCAQYVAHIDSEIALAGDVLMRPELGIASPRLCDILDGVSSALRKWKPSIEERVGAGVVVEGHGDLKPEHVCLLEPPQIFDCLEFDSGMRIIDPFDEVNYLGLECELLGAGWIRPILLDLLEDRMGNAPDRRMVSAYGAFRSVLRARLCLSHLLDAYCPSPDFWRGRALAYLGMAESECGRAQS